MLNLSVQQLKRNSQFWFDWHLCKLSFRFVLVQAIVYVTKPLALKYSLTRHIHLLRHSTRPLILTWCQIFFFSILCNVCVWVSADCYTWVYSRQSSGGSFDFSIDFLRNSSAISVAVCECRWNSLIKTESFLEECFCCWLRAITTNSKNSMQI